MRYQERIYIQNEISAVRNRNFNNFNMSSDMCVFNNPLYNVSGATKILCCECPDELVPHDTYNGNTVILPTAITNSSDCADFPNFIDIIINQTIIDYGLSGETAIEQWVEVEELLCGRVVKWKGVTQQVWTVNMIDGDFSIFNILDYTDTQNTIQRAHVIQPNTAPCCDGLYSISFSNWNNFINSLTLTGTTNYLVDIPYGTNTSCSVAKVPCTTGGTITGASYIISANTQTIPLTFDFTANTQTFIDTEANFRYEIYKYDNSQSQFSAIPVYKSQRLNYSAFSATNTTTEYIPSSGITLDGDYLVKGFYQFSACTDFLKRLGKGVDTINYKYGSQYGIYDNNLDYYFIALKQAEIPYFTNNGSNDTLANSLTQSVYLPAAGIQNIPKPQNIGDFIMTLNGLVLANGSDYTYTGDVVTLNGFTAEDDIITFIYTSIGGTNLIADNIDVTTSIVSGATNGQGSNLVYFNTTSGKYEIYTSVEPAPLNDIIVMLNGVTLANNVDYYQSTSNLKRIILEGDLVVGDIITIVYFPANSTVNGLNTNNPIVSWLINELPQKENGYFSLEVSTNNAFTNFYYTGYTPYNTATISYSDSFIASGTIGTTLYYRVKNEKNYETLCGNIITSVAYSDIVPIVIQSNAINSY